MVVTASKSCCANTRGDCAVFAIGKAAAAMALGAHDALGARIRQMLVITKDGHSNPELARLAGVTILESAHPVPDERSLAAGAEFERALANLDEQCYPIFLVSGGSSSLVEILRDGCHPRGAARVQRARACLGAGPIEALNAERAKLSRLKAGGVARCSAGRPATALFISDVPHDDPGVIGSGLLGQDGLKDDNILRIVRCEPRTWRCGRLPMRRMRTASGCSGARERFDGDAADVAHEFVEALRATEADGLVWGGESTVKLPGKTRSWRPQYASRAGRRATAARR